MTYYPDLTPYAYEPSDRPMLNVGWLAADRPFPEGVVADCVLKALRVLSVARDHQMRGRHECEFCGVDMPRVVGGPDESEEVVLGSAEIHVPAATGLVYAAPNLVLHYIAEHFYCPPEEFCAAAANAAGLECPDVLILPA